MSSGDRCGSLETPAVCGVAAFNAIMDNWSAKQSSVALVGHIRSTDHRQPVSTASINGLSPPLPLLRTQQMSATF